mmetsp:Transcript_68871/g.121718  ORF Transcript_68871/g.121718 Transcript_68871/m.121718 type:complete len:349 (+) Transcript_68871:44-1090(+)
MPLIDLFGAADSDDAASIADDANSRSRSRSRNEGTPRSDKTDESPDPTPSCGVFMWEKRFADACGLSAQQLDMLQTPVTEPFVLATGCSCTGAPSFALRKIIGAGNFQEILGSEMHGATRDFYMQNHKPATCYADIEHARTGGKCYVKQMHAEPPADREDLYVAGFVCKNFSQENGHRYKINTIQELFDVDDASSSRSANSAKTFLEVSRHIRNRRPKWVILENVFGCLKKMKNCPEDAEYKVHNEQQALLLWSPLQADSSSHAGYAWLLGRRHGVQGLQEAIILQPSCRQLHERTSDWIMHLRNHCGGLAWFQPQTLEAGERSGPVWERLPVQPWLIGLCASMWRCF